jgi:hypothetical protein
MLTKTELVETKICKGMSSCSGCIYSANVKICKVFRPYEELLSSHLEAVDEIERLKQQLYNLNKNMV